MIATFRFQGSNHTREFDITVTASSLKEAKTKIYDVLGQDLITVLRSVEIDSNLNQKEEVNVSS